MMRGPVAVGALAAFTLAGAACGSSSGGSGAGGGQTLGQEFPKIKAAALAAHSVRMSGSVLQDGRRLSLDMALQKPSDAAGTFTEGSTSFAIVAAGGRTYIKINKAFLKLAHVPTRLCARVCGKYVDATASSGSAFSGLTITSLMKDIFKTSPSSSEDALKLTSGQFQGQPVWKVSGSGVTVYISKGSTPYLLSMTMHGQQVSFSGWNTTTISAPPASQVMTEAQLGAMAAGA